MTHSKQHHPIWLIYGSVLGVIALLFGLMVYSSVNNNLPETQNATIYPANFRPIPHFVLHDQHGQDFTLNSLRSKWNLMFFGYTSCPDVCPNTLHVINQITAKINGPENQIQTIFVSIDPLRDSAEQLQKYLAYFGPDFIGLSGEHSELKPLSNSLGIFYTKPTNAEQTGYLLDHNAGIFLINPNGKPHALFSAPHNAKAIANDITLLINHFEEAS